MGKRAEQTSFIEIVPTDPAGNVIKRRWPKRPRGKGVGDRRVEAMIPLTIKQRPLVGLPGKDQAAGEK